MSEYRKNQILEQFRRPHPSKSSKSRDIKGRLTCLKPKQTFLTDTQTSDYTKSSGQMNPRNVQQLEETVYRLEKENSELKQKIIDLKTNQFFQINEEKLRAIIKETEKFREELEKTKQSLQQSLVQRDYLERFNKNLKAQCEILTKQVLTLKAQSNSDSKRQEKVNSSSKDEVESNKSRNSSTDYVIIKKKETIQTKKQEGTNAYSLKQAKSVSRLHEEYYTSTRNRPKVQKNH